MVDAPSAENLNPLQSFGMDVRQVRLARKMTMKGLGRATGYSEGYVSKVEKGQIPSSKKFATGADHALGTGDLFTRQLRRILEGDHPNWFLPYIQLEREAVRIHDFSTTFIMGMLQTEEYARAVFRAGIPREAEDVIESRVAARVQRHDIMERPTPPLLWVVFHEACLRMVVGGPGVMARQLTHLALETESPSVTIQVLPFGAGPPAHHLPFTLLGFDGAPTLLHAEGPQGGRPYDRPQTVAVASDKYDRLRADALSPGGSVALIKRIAKEYTDEQRCSDRDMDQVQLQRTRRWPVRRVGPRVRVGSRRRPRPGQQGD